MQKQRTKHQTGNPRFFREDKQAGEQGEAWIRESDRTDGEHFDSPSRFVWGEGDVEIENPPEHEE